MSVLHNNHGCPVFSGSFCRGTFIRLNRARARPRHPVMNCMMESLWASQARQTTTVMMVAGTLVTQKIQSLSDTCQLPSSAKLKKVVLKMAYCEVRKTTLTEAPESWCIPR